MIEISSIKVRLIEEDDIKGVCSYWANASNEDLERMGAVPEKVPDYISMYEYLSKDILKNVRERKSVVSIWEYNGEAIGHCNIIDVVEGEHAHLHLHLWRSDLRKKGIGLIFLKKSLDLFVKEFSLKYIIAEPNANNLAPNKILPKAGFSFVKKYKTIPGSLSDEQYVNQWKFKV